MQHKIFVFALLMWVSISAASAQVDETRNYIYFFSDSVLYCRNVELGSSFSRGTYLMCDTLVVDPYRVKFFRGETGFFANTMKINFSGTATFCERVRRGKINLYERDVTTSSPGFYGPNGMYTSGGATRTIKNFYNKGFGDLKKASYKNLVVDLSDNPESMLYLDKYKKASRKETIFGIAGGALIVGGIATLINAAKNSPGLEKPNNTPGTIITVTGAVGVWTSYFIYLSKPKHLRNAIDAYNK